MTAFRCQGIRGSTQSATSTALAAHARRQIPGADRGRRILGESAAAAIADGPGSPRVIFTDPQVAAVGVTLAAALEAGLPAIAVDLPTGVSAGASFVGHGGTGNVTVCRRHRAPTCCRVSPSSARVADFLQAASIAVAGEVPLYALAHAIAPFPTRSELWLSFLEAYEKQQA